MNFDFDHPAPTGSLPPEEYWAFCEEMIRRNPRVSSETCMAMKDDERWMEAPFTLAQPTKRLSRTHHNQ
ncbi:MAG: hypothetical protein JJU29_09450 [Verrucomicrobia bacterium]|nr:hypothetical protein [Verrucomicrobiota bacterium]MCH8510882.1 hypothetical protein [Kiritimatiellia bacterium]